ncbi:MAG: sn-glycerol-1-phosphate dehydrogenase [Anaerolineales bacterium]|nr:sn-glycerol-1-phosphate dehydrogenase [Anaerolineales bacterium]
MAEKNQITGKKSVLFSIGSETIPQLLEFLRDRGISRVILVSDENEYRALGARVEQALQQNSIEVHNVVLRGEAVSADEVSITQALLPSDESNQMYIAVGSGTLTDIVRFVSYRAKSDFICLPTAPSVDGFASSGSSMTINGFKQTILSKPPLAIFADMDTLCNAPPGLIASGFGDMFGKYSALADWKLAHLIVNEPYNDVIAKRSRAARDSVAAASFKLTEDHEGSVLKVMEALVEEGLCMLEYGNSRPASGAEHHFSHYWEMKLLREKRPAVFHGSKVGIASIIIAGCYQLLHEISRDEAAACLSRTVRPDPEHEKDAIIRGFGNRLAETVTGTQAFYLSMADGDYQDLKNSIISHWDKVKQIAEQVPGQEVLINMLKQVGGVYHPSSLGMTDQDVLDALTYAHYVRGGFTILKLGRMLGWTAEFLFEMVVKGIPGDY